MNARATDAAIRTSLAVLDMLPVLFHKADALVAAALEEAASEAALTTRAVTVLTEVVSAEPRSQRELSERTGIDPTSLVAAIDELEGYELVRRVRNPQDRRQYRVEPTDEGIAVVARTAETLQRIEEEVFVGLTADERGRLAAMVRKVLEAHPSHAGRR